MTAEQDDFLGLLAAANLAHHVGRLGVRLESTAQRQADAHALTTTDEAHEAVRVFGGNRRCRNRRHALPVLHGAGMRGPQANRPDRADQNGDRALQRGRAGAAGPVGDGVAVRRERRIEQDDAPACVGTAAPQFVETRDNQHVAFDAAGRCRDRAAKPQNLERTLRRDA